MSQQYKPGDTAYFDFTVTASNGALANADALPTAQVVHNGAIDGAVVVTVNAAIATGVYSGSYTIPGTYAAGDDVRVIVKATVGGVAGGGIVDRYRLVSWGPSGVRLDLTQLIPSTNAADSIGDALAAARAQGYGKWTLVGNTLTLYRADGTTIGKTFTLDSPTAPTQRY